MTLLLLVAPAFADTVADTAAPPDPEICNMPEVLETLPRPTQTQVPLDARVIALLSPKCDTRYAEPVTATLYEVVDGVEVAIAWDTLERPTRQPMLVLDPSAEMAADTDHLLRIEGGGPTVEVGFTTGAALLVGLGDTRPVLEVEDYTSQHKFDDRWTVDASGRVTAAEDPDGLSWIQVAIDRYTLFDEAAPESGEAVEFDVSQEIRGRGAAPEDVCVSAVQVLGDGTEVEGEPWCDTPEEVIRFGCSAAPGAASAAGWLALVGLGFRRRLPSR